MRVHHQVALKTNILGMMTKTCNISLGTWWGLVLSSVFADLTKKLYDLKLYENPHKYMLGSDKYYQGSVTNVAS